MIDNLRIESGISFNFCRKYHKDITTKAMRPFYKIGINEDQWYEILVYRDADEVLLRPCTVLTDNEGNKIDSYYEASEEIKNFLQELLEMSFEQRSEVLENYIKSKKSLLKFKI